MEIPENPIYKPCEFDRYWKCTVTGTACLADARDNPSQHCLRYSWVKRLQSKTAQIARLHEELIAITQEELL
jgi:hypothetical protein